MRFATTQLARALHAYGALKGRPAVASFVELAAYTAPSGRVLVVDLVQLISSALWPAVAVIPGLSWEAYLAEPKGENPKRLSLTSDTDTIGWTYTHGTPVVRNLLVPSGRRLIWGARVDPALLPADITALAGAIVGFEVDAELEALEALRVMAIR
jgi:hypothetical protein